MKAERRAVARYQEKLAVQINMNDFSTPATAMEISLRGLRVVCEGPAASGMFSRYIRVTPGENIIVDMQIKLPNPSGLTESLGFQTKVISVNRVSQNSYVVGFEIVKLATNDLEVWQDYISSKH